MNIFDLNQKKAADCYKHIKYKHNKILLKVPCNVQNIKKANNELFKKLKQT